jgi:hypothetical protein
VKHWYKWISNTTSIAGETLRYMNIKHYKYNWWNIDIHEYILVVFDIHVYQYFISYACSVLIFMYINVSPAILVVFDIHVNITGETLI